MDAMNHYLWMYVYMYEWMDALCLYVSYLCNTANTVLQVQSTLRVDWIMERFGYAAYLGMHNININY